MKTSGVRAFGKSKYNGNNYVYTLSKKDGSRFGGFSLDRNDINTINVRRDIRKIYDDSENIVKKQYDVIKKNASLGKMSLSEINDANANYRHRVNELFFEKINKDGIDDVVYRRIKK